MGWREAYLDHTAMNDSIQNEWNQLVKQSRKNPAKPPTEPPPEPARKWYGKWVVPSLFALSLVALGLFMRGTLNPWPSKPSQDQLVTGQHASLLLVSKAIHDYATFHGKYPQSISEVLPLTINVDYRLTSDGFELKTIDADGTPIVIRGK
jgi:hypothetical protein